MSSLPTKSAGVLARVNTCAIPLVCWLMLMGAFLFHFSLVAKYAVDLPFWDDWDLFPKHGLEWIFSFQNEHRMVSTKLLIKFFYELNGWDIAVHQVFNFLLFGLIVFIATLCISRWNPDWKSWQSALFSIFLLSPVSAESHHWATCSSLHFVIFFILLSVIFLFAEKPSWFKSLAGCLFLLLAAYSAASGMAAAAGIYLVWSIGRLFSQRDLPRMEVRSSLIEWIVVSIVFMLGMAAYFIGYHQPAGHYPPALPWTIHFWESLGVIVQTGISWPRFITFKWPLIGVGILLALCVAPLCLLLHSYWRSRKSIPVCLWAFISFTTAILSIVSFTAVGRGNFPLQLSASGRYSEYSLFLIPISAVLWHLALYAHPTLRRKTILILWLFFALLQCRTLISFGQYKYNFNSRSRDSKLVSQYYKDITPCDFYLPDFWLPLNKYLKEAQQKKISFYLKALETEKFKDIP